MSLQLLGWNERWQQEFESATGEGFAAGRVLAEFKELYRIGTDAGEFVAQVAGKLRHQVVRRSDFPAVGDFVTVRLPQGDGPALIQAVLPRKSAFIRKAAGEGVDEQVVAANVDAVFIVTALDHDFNLRRIERHLALVWQSGAQPVILLNKADLSDGNIDQIHAIGGIAAGTPLHVISALNGEGLETLESHLRPGSTVSFVGSSGVGKSTLLNKLLGHDVQATQQVREHDSRGRHTSTHRELFVLPTGALIIDCPGMRELQVGNIAEGIQRAFLDIESLAARGRFRDCAHADEPGCAVREAVECGQLDKARLASFDKLRKEMRYNESRIDKHAGLERKRQYKLGNKAMKQFKTK